MKSTGGKRDLTETEGKRQKEAMCKDRNSKQVARTGARYEAEYFCVIRHTNMLISPPAPCDSRLITVICDGSDAFSILVTLLCYTSANFATIQHLSVPLSSNNSLLQEINKRQRDKDSTSIGGPQGFPVPLTHPVKFSCISIILLSPQTFPLMHFIAEICIQIPGEDVRGKMA